MGDTPLSYFVDRLSTSRPLSPKTIQKFKHLRLEALSSNPSSFLATFDYEKGFTDDQWRQLILDPTHHYLICHTSREREGIAVHEDNLIREEWTTEDEWVGILLLLGPYQTGDYGATPLLQPTALGADDEETRWHLTSLYLQPDHRREDSFTIIHEAILGYLRVWTDEHLATKFADETNLEKPKRARVAGLLRTEDDQLLEMYKMLAGQTVGWADRRLGARIAGIDHSPEGEPLEELNMRIMERIIEC